MTICTWTDEETDDNVMGSGCDAWEWYVTLIGPDPDNAAGYVVVMLNGDDEATTYRFTRSKVRSTVTAMAMGKLPVNDRIRQYAKDDDMDADSMDCVIQWICYGEIIYG